MQAEKFVILRTKAVFPRPYERKLTEAGEAQAMAGVCPKLLLFGAAGSGGRPVPSCAACLWPRLGECGFWKAGKVAADGSFG